MMTAEEIAWLDAYHARVKAEIGPKLDARDRAWLERGDEGSLGALTRRP